LDHGIVDTFVSATLQESMPHGELPASILDIASFWESRRWIGLTEHRHQGMIDAHLETGLLSGRDGRRERTHMGNDLSSVVDALPGLVWSADPDGRVDFLNSHWCEYTGLSVAEAYGVGWQLAIHPSDRPSLRHRWRSILAAGESGVMEARLRRFDGEYRWFLFCMRPLTEAAGQIVKWFGTSTDIHDLRRPTMGQHAREDDYRSITDIIPAMIAFLTPDGKIEDANRHVLEYLGTTLEELKGRKASEAIHPDDLPLVIAAWERAVATGEPYDIDHRIRRADGVYRWFHGRGMPLRDMRGHIVRGYLVNTDIDDRKRAEAMLAGEKRLLEMVARRRSMSEILEALCQLVENTVNGCYCSVVLVDQGCTRLEHGAAPSLPASFIASIIGRPVNIDSGPCAMAAYLNEQVIASDLALETRWAAYAWCPMAIAHGLQACWSTPIASDAGKVLGAFAVYYGEPRTPTPQEQGLIDQFMHIASIAIDRAQGDGALRRSEARKAAILDAALDCIITIDHEGCVTEFNPAAERTFGYRRHELVGKQLADAIIPPSLREKHRQGLARYLATGEKRLMGRRVEMTAVRADGSEIPVELAISRIALEGPPSFTCYLRDITERIATEDELRRSESFLAEGQRLSLTGTFSWRVAADKIMWSEQTYRIFGVDPSVPVTLELIGHRVHPDDTPLLFDMVERARGDGGDFEYDHRLQMPDGSVKYLHLIGHGTRDKDGRLEYIGAVQDVTQRRLAEQALGEARSELAHVARVASLGTLTASIAHEVNQPLSGIVTNASTCLRMLAADPPNVEGARETAQRTIRDGNRASDVIKRLRALFSKRNTTIESLDLNEAAREVLALSLADLQRNRVILEAKLASVLPPVTGDRVQLQQVILNLLQNASDAMSSVDDRPRRLVIRTERDEGDHVRLMVQDAGVGFPPQDADRLFDTFYTTKDSGMGIGLSVSRSIVETHHGRLWAVPNDGPGATVSFSIPCRSADTKCIHRFGTTPRFDIGEQTMRHL
jgi:PAS domain S-box-containing protein